MTEKLHILAIAAHPDDVELSCAGTIIRHSRQGQRTGILDLTMGELGTRGSAPLRLKEAAAAAEVMGVAVRENAGFADGFFLNDESHQRILISWIRRWQPDIVLANAPEDRHPDHGRASKLISDACFLSGLRRIETAGPDGQSQEAWRPKRVFHYIQDRMLTPSFIVDISDTFEQKMEAIKCYGSQFHVPDSGEPATYIATQNFLHQIRYRDALLGKRIGTEYGEGFISDNIIGLSHMDSLLLPEIA